MGKQFIWVLIFILITFIGDRIAGRFLRGLTEKSQFRYSRLYFSKEDADILFVGNSRGLTFYQPEAESLTALKTMNISYNGMPADLAKCLVMDYLDHHKPPKTMVVDVTLCDRTNEMLISSMNPYSMYSERLSDLIKNTASTKIKQKFSTNLDTLDKYAGKKVYYGGKVFELYRYNSEVFQRILYHRNKSDKDQLIDRVIGEAAMTDTAMKSYDVRMFPQMVSQLKEMVQYAQAKGVEVKLVINPYLPAFAESIQDSFLTPLKQYVETQTGLQVRDYSKVLTEREHIGDYQHANKKGSIRYMQILNADGILTNNQKQADLGFFIPENNIDTSKITKNTEAIPVVYTPSVSENNQKPENIKSENLTVKGLAPKLVSKPTKTKTKRHEDWISIDTLFSH